ncbi:hypothetical protein OB919_02730 [Halobacteria archaeon AArc-curdl1]|uniref:Uncharacterized protein n=1 Tax=Natronosalvus hydrolyticus TaxID=2979988 RepID=A0AAP2Z5R5_9EURY|nr:hypothetical protein [Halobacteria archaeon AArc-curdl1]
MPDISFLVLTALRLLVLGLGAAITYTSYRAYRRTGGHYLRTAAIGFGIITVGVFIEGALVVLFDVSIRTAHIVESAVIVVGFVVLLYSFRQ